MSRIHLPVAVLAAVLLLGAAPASVGAASTGGTLVAIRASHHPGFDRVVFEFSGGLPRLANTAWSADAPAKDPSALPSGAQGNAFFTIVFWDAVGHEIDPPYDSTYGPARRAFDLPNVAHVVNIGDWEATLTFTIGVMKQPGKVRVTSLADPPRWVVDLGTWFPKKTVSVRFVDLDRLDGAPPYVVKVDRMVPVAGTPRSTMHRLFAGPTIAERQDGLRFRTSEATDWTRLRISDLGVARIQLVGGCDSNGQTVTIANEIRPTLRGLSRVDWVKIHDPDGTTQEPWGLVDSIPTCLE